ncbi:hypothetical protein F5877DRAFT_70671 [Lentinula edodes]|nr:hypothetical protein F5877DRAFT_70671 [Lentinula edodes]
MTRAREPKESQAGYILGGRPECSGWTLKSENEEEKKDSRNLELPYTVANLVNRLDLSICAPTPRRIHAYAPKGYVRVACDFHPAIKARPKMTRLSMVLQSHEKQHLAIRGECKISHYMPNNRSSRGNCGLVLLPGSGIMAAMQCIAGPGTFYGTDSKDLGSREQS